MGFGKGLINLCISFFFFVILKAAEALDKAGKCEESKQAYKQAYDVLLRMYRRRP